MRVLFLNINLMGNAEGHVKQLLRQAGYALSNKELKQLIQSYNDYEMPISERLYSILESPEDFLIHVRNNLSRISSNQKIKVE